MFGGSPAQRTAEGKDSQPYPAGEIPAVVAQIADAIFSRPVDGRSPAGHDGRIITLARCRQPSPRPDAEPIRPQVILRPFPATTALNRVWKGLVPHPKGSVRIGSR